MIAEQKLSMPQDDGCVARCCLQIGGVSLGFAAHGMDFHLESDHKNFVIPTQSCEIEIEMFWAERLTSLPGRKLFDSGAVWSLYEDHNHLIFDFVTPHLGTEPYKRLRINKDFSLGQVFFSQRCFPNPECLHPLEYPMDELIVTNWLAREGRGAEVHGCGLARGQEGQLFVGHSGAGKSTTTRLWQSLSGCRILSDDRIIIRKEAIHQQNLFSMYGTPWHGEAGFASPEKTSIKQIFVLEHGNKNEITLLPQPAAVAELFARCFLPFHDPEALTSTLAFLDDLTRHVACYRFRFVPDSSAVEKILGFNHSR